MKSIIEIINLKKFRLLWHILFWILYVLFNTLMQIRANREFDFSGSVIRLCITLPVDIIASYFTVYFLFPWFLLKNKYYQFFIYFIISAVAMAFLQRALTYYVTYPIYYSDSVSASAGYYKFNILYLFFNIYPVVGIVATIKLLKSSFHDRQITQTLEKEKMEAELKFLKAQIHPHFLFNTLNNLYALTLDKSDQAPEVVIKLSNLLDYMLYECNTPKVPVEKEINIIKNYLSLEQMRYGKELNIKFAEKGTSKNLEIAPMILLPFIENSFKHGLSKNTKDPWINISINFSGNSMLFNVQNNKIKEEQKNSEDYTEGIGLKNVQRRLELIYNKRHDLLISDKGETFDIFLKIEL